MKAVSFSSVGQIQSETFLFRTVFWILPKTRLHHLHVTGNYMKVLISKLHSKKGTIVVTLLNHLISFRLVLPDHVNVSFVPNLWAQFNKRKRSLTVRVRYAPRPKSVLRSLIGCSPSETTLNSAKQTDAWWFCEIYRGSLMVILMIICLQLTVEFDMRFTL